MIPRTSDLSRPMPNATVATTILSSPHMKLFWTRRRSDADRPAWYDSACHFSGLRIFFLAECRSYHWVKVLNSENTNGVMIYFYSSLTQVFLSLSYRVVLHLAAAVALLVFFHQHTLQAGPEQRRHTNGLLPSGAVDDDGIQTTKTIAFQQGH